MAITGLIEFRADMMLLMRNGGSSIARTPEAGCRVAHV